MRFCCVHLFKMYLKSQMKLLYLVNNSFSMIIIIIKLNKNFRVVFKQIFKTTKIGKLFTKFRQTLVFIK